MNEKITIGKNIVSSIDKLIDSISPFKSVVITDTKVEDLWLDKITGRIEAKPIVISEGERYKTLETVKYIWKVLLDMNFTRKSLIIALGGGVVTDLSAFVSSTFKRGTKLGLIPTTLLGQVDAAIGGKTGINLNGKNMVGTFYEPDFVLIDTVFLNTLPREELQNGFGEVIKYGLLTNQVKKLLLKNTDRKSINLIEKCVEYKDDVVQRDLEERGIRRVLNLGHTVGHAIEKLSNYSIKHGNAVSIGLMVNSLISEEIYGFDSSITSELFKKYDMPLSHDFSPKDILEAMKDDKKNWYEDIVLVLLRDVGDIEIENVDHDIILNALEKTKKSV
ncbi:MAG: 3-dehydroquinate synthase [Thermoplasmatota archaeon]